MRLGRSDLPAQREGMSGREETKRQT